MKKKLKLTCRVVLIAITVSWLAGCGTNASTDEASNVTLGARTFLIPKPNQMEVAMPEWLRRFPGLDDGSKSFLVKFPATDIAKSIPGYRTSDGSYQEDISGVLSALTPIEAQRYEQFEHLSDLWHGEGSYRDAVVKPYTILGWYKVYRKVEYPYSWALLKYLPAAGQSIPPNSAEFWVAQCVEGGSMITASKKHVACKSFVQFEDMTVDFELSEQNIEYIDQIRAFIKAQVIDWKQ